MLDFIRAIKNRKNKRADKIIDAYNREMMDLCECCHDPNQENNSLIEGPRRTMVYPEEFVFLCKFCGRSFVFNREDGKYIKTGHKSKGR